MFLPPSCRTYKSHQTNEVDIETVLPLLQIGLRDSAHLSQDSVVEDHPIQLAKGLQGKINRLLGEGEVSQVAIEHFHLLIVLRLEVLEWLWTTRHDHNIVRLRGSEKVLCRGQADPCDVVSVWDGISGGVLLPLEAPVTMIVLADIFSGVWIVAGSVRPVKSLFWMCSGILVCHALPAQYDVLCLARSPRLLPHTPFPLHVLMLIPVCRIARCGHWIPESWTTVLFISIPAGSPSRGPACFWCTLLRAH